MTDRLRSPTPPSWTSLARIKDESVERVKATMEILPLVEEMVRLRKSGSRYTGLCPFHQERTPSFTSRRRAARSSASAAARAVTRSRSS